MPGLPWISSRVSRARAVGLASEFIPVVPTTGSRMSGIENNLPCYDRCEPYGHHAGRATSDGGRGRDVVVRAGPHPARVRMEVRRTGHGRPQQAAAFVGDDAGRV